MLESTSAHQNLHRAVRRVMVADMARNSTFAPDAGWNRIQASWTSAKENGHATPWDGIPGFAQSRLRWGQVDIYLSAGPVERDASGHILRSCTRDSVVNCSLWRIRWDFATRWFTEIELVRAAQAKVSDSWCTGGMGYFMPAVSPSGRGLAYVAACYENQAGHDYHARSAIEVQDHDPWTFVRGVAAGSVATDTSTQYPNWYDDERLLFDRPGDGTSNVDRRYTLWEATNWPAFGTQTAWAGPGGIYHQEESFSDPHTTRTPIDRPGFSSRIVTFGGTQSTLTNGTLYTKRVPRTSTKYGSDVEEAVLPTDWATPTQAAECHHPAWNITGDQILCTRYQNPETITGGDPDQDARRLWALSWDGTSWGNAQPLVGLLTRDGFNETSKDPFQLLLNNVFPPRAGVHGAAVCADYVWKFGEWCGSNRYAVATLYCTNDAMPPGEDDGDQGVNVEVLSSRVMLIDLWGDDDAGTGTPDAYTDLVSFLEYIEGATPGSWHGWFATCAAVELEP